MRNPETILEWAGCVWEGASRWRDGQRCLERDASSGLHGLVMGDDGPIWPLDSDLVDGVHGPKPKWATGSTAPPKLDAVLAQPVQVCPLR